MKRSSWVHCLHSAICSEKSYAQLTHAPVYMEIVEMLAVYLKVNSEGIKHLEYASLLHDIGIIDVPYDILSKQGKLSPRVRADPRAYGAKRCLDFARRVFFEPVLPIILHHHEKYDGSGYPSGLKKEQIPLGPVS